MSHSQHIVESLHESMPHMYDPIASLPQPLRYPCEVVFIYTSRPQSTCYQICRHPLDDSLKFPWGWLHAPKKGLSIYKVSPDVCFIILGSWKGHTVCNLSLCHWTRGKGAWFASPGCWAQTLEQTNCSKRCSHFVDRHFLCQPPSITPCYLFSYSFMLVVLSFF